MVALPSGAAVSDCAMSSASGTVLSSPSSARAVMGKKAQNRLRQRISAKSLAIPFLSLSP